MASSTLISSPSTAGTRSLSRIFKTSHSSRTSSSSLRQIPTVDALAHTPSKPGISANHVPSSSYLYFAVLQGGVDVSNKHFQSRSIQRLNLYEICLSFYSNDGDNGKSAVGPQLLPLRGGRAEPPRGESVEPSKSGSCGSAPRKHRDLLDR